ncbi:unnamed protein product [Rhizophagus irregularis]|nr:unnamed protein product [Rhizophagus irregularis]
MLKWTHFLKNNNLSLRIEPKWFKIVKDRITVNSVLERELNNEILIKKSEVKETNILRKDETHKSRKNSNKEVITWKKENDINSIYSIRSKKSRHHYYEEIGKHMIEYDKLQSNNDINNSPFLINCQGCEYNISRKKNLNTGCFIYIEKDIASTLQGRWEKDRDGLKYIKPYSSLQNIDKRNELMYNKEKNNNDNIVNMIVDKENNMLRLDAKVWLKNIVETTGIYTNLENFVDTNFVDFIDKELILQIGGVIQKGSELNLDGYFSFEIFAKNSNIEKFSIEGKILRTKNERKLYAIGIIVALTIIPDNTIVDLRTDTKIINWLIEYSNIGSVRRELDDQCYIFLNCINAMLDLKNIKIIMNNGVGSDQVLMKEIKLPALKKELIRCKDTIKEVVINYTNIVD